MKRYLGKDYENLFTLDFICHGVPSPGVFGKYVAELSEQGEVAKISFRDKETLGWNMGLAAWYRDGRQMVDRKENLYMDGFLSNMYLRNSCYDCHFKGRRYSDITLGDLWGAKHIWEEADGSGTSVVLINTEKGRQLYGIAAGRIKRQKLVDTEEVARWNTMMVMSSEPSPYRSEFFSHIWRLPFSEAMKKTWSKKRYDVALVCWWSYNYGNALTNYALYRMVEKLGYSVAVIDHMGFAPYGKFAEFAERHYCRTSQWHQSNNACAVNRMFDTFLVGSDQVWNFGISSLGSASYFHLGFVEGDKRKLSYAASFGAGNADAPKKLVPYYKVLYQRFWKISVREAFGVDICREQYGVEATHVLDPVFLLEREDYEALLQGMEQAEEPYILTYILDPTPGKLLLLKEMQKLLGGIRLINIMDAAISQVKKNRSVFSEMGMEALFQIEPERWLWYYKYASFVITDSYHGTCFSIIFEKRFVCLKNRQRDRFATILGISGMEERIWEWETGDCEAMLGDIDYESVRKQLNEKRERSRAWLEEALQCPNL